MVRDIKAIDVISIIHVFISVEDTKDMYLPFVLFDKKLV